MDGRPGNAFARAGTSCHAYTRSLHAAVRTTCREAQESQAFVDAPLCQSTRAPGPRRHVRQRVPQTNSGAASRRRHLRGVCRRHVRMPRQTMHAPPLRLPATQPVAQYSRSQGRVLQDAVPAGIAGCITIELSKLEMQRSGTVDGRSGDG